MIRNIVKYIKQNLIPISVFIICTYALYLRLMSLYRHWLWCDELWELNQMRGPFLDFLKQLTRHEVCSYLSGDSYLIYPFFKIFSFNKWGLAIPHIIATILGFYLLYLICKKYFKTVWGYLVTFVVICFNFWLIYHATEIRPYAVLPTLSLASLYLMQLLADNDFQVSFRKRMAFGAFFIILIWFHVYGILIFFCTAAFALFSRKDSSQIWPLMKNSFKFILVILIITMPLWIYSSFISPRYLLKYYKMSVTDFIPAPFVNPIAFLKAIFGNLVGLKKIYFLLLGLIFPFILPFKDRFKMILFLLFLVFIPIASIYILDTIVIYCFIPRQFVWVTPLFAIYLGWSWDSLYILLKQNIIKKKKPNG